MASSIVSSRHKIADLLVSCSIFACRSCSIAEHNNLALSGLPRESMHGFDTIRGVWCHQHRRETSFVYRIGVTLCFQAHRAMLAVWVMSVQEVAGVHLHTRLCGGHSHATATVRIAQSAHNSNTTESSAIAEQTTLCRTQQRLIRGTVMLQKLSCQSNDHSLVACHQQLCGV
jgi:hypothetical protein